MKKWIFLLLALSAGLYGAFAYRFLPVDNRDLVDVKYSGWSGVLRIRLCEGWQCGSGTLTGWLNRCAASFEKRHNGVYVQITPVGHDQLLNTAAGLRPPDAILFAPGMLGSADGLTELGKYPLRANNVRTSRYAVPVAMGGYVLAIADAAPPTVSMPPDDAYHSWSAALLALMTDGGASGAPVPESPGVDLGLPAQADMNALTIKEAETPFTDFSNGETRAMPATQRELARLQALSREGKGPDWHAEALSEFTFTDQLLLFAVPEDGDTQRVALVLDFLGHLLSEECQRALGDAGAFPVTDAPAGYAASEPMAALDLTLRSENLITPPVFDNNWRSDARDALQFFRTGSRSAREVFRNLFAFS